MNEQLTTFKFPVQALADEDDWVKPGKPLVILYYADGTVERFINNKKVTN